MIQVQNLNKTYDRGKRHANHVLRDISLTLPDTGFVCILGVSGCGKTSLLNAISGLDRFDSGTLTASDVTVNRYGTASYEAQRNNNFGYIFQNYYLLMDHSAAYNVYLGLHSLALTHREKMERVRQALKAVEMEHYFHRTVGELSGGQQQRVAIARALARKSRVIFADEPTGNLDEANTIHICTLLRKISATSLVIMVTHEERIAHFFADRIITLEDGRVAEDSKDFARNPLKAEGSNTLYTGDFDSSILENSSAKLQLYTQPGASPVELTVVTLTDRVIIKLSDSRTLTCGTPDQTPILKSGKRPVLKLEELEQAPDIGFLQDTTVQKHTKAGRGIPFSMLLREAFSLSGRKGLRKLGTRLFLILLSGLMLFTVSDYLTVSSIDPEDFITADSHILEVSINRGPVLYPDSRSEYPLQESYYEYLRSSGQDFTFVPKAAARAEYTVTLFKQMEDVILSIGACSYAPLSTCDPSTLIYGRMPENPEEIVVDRWLLEAAAEKDGIIQNSISDVSFFLNGQLHYSKRNYSPTIVGICDSGEPTIYMDTPGMISIGVCGVAVTPLSYLQAKYPGQYDDVVLAEGECIVVTNNAGVMYTNQIGSWFITTPRGRMKIMDAIEADVSGSIVVDDSQLDTILWDMVTDLFYLYCPDKEQMKVFLEQNPSDVEKDDYVIIEVKDNYSSTYAAYAAATSRKADARTIVTVTVILLAMLMLYLLQRTQAQQRLEMLAVYRLLGIPGKKLTAIFSIESLLLCLTTVLPAGVLVWGYFQAAAKIPELDKGMLLPWPAAAIVCLGIFGYHLLVSLLPVWRLLRLPPAQLAAKYDL